MEYNVLLMLNIIMLIIVIYIIMLTFKAPESEIRITFFFMLFGIFLYKVSSIIELANSTNLFVILTVVKYEYIGLGIYLIAILRFTFNLARIKEPNYLVALQSLAILPSVIGAITLEKHDLFYQDYYFYKYNNLTFIRFDYGVLWYVFYIHILLISLVLIFYCLKKIKSKSKGIKKRFFLFLIGLVICGTESILIYTNVILTTNSLNVGLVVTLVFSYFSFVKTGYFDALKLAKQKIIFDSDQAVLVIDKYGYVILYNKTVGCIFPELDNETKVSNIKRLKKALSLEGDFAYKDKYYNFCDEALKQDNNDILGRIVWMHDVTKKHEEVENLNKDKNNLEVELEKSSQENQERILAGIYALASSIDARDQLNKGHSKRVADYAYKMAKKAGFIEEKCKSIYQAGLLHDIGKVSIPDYILNKPDCLSKSEYEVMKTHTIVGAEIVKTIEYIPSLLDGVKYHHERFDGCGYPDKLRGKNIPEVARIIAVADCYDAMTSNRIYRNKISKSVVIEELKKQKNKQFDPYYVDLLIKIVSEKV